MYQIMTDSPNFGDVDWLVIYNFSLFRWTNQRSGTDSETEGEEATATRERENGANHVRYMGGPVTGGQVPSPQLTLAEFLQK